MDTDSKFFTVEFEKAITRVLIVPTQYPTIEDAVLAASAGDTQIILNEGVHNVTSATGIDLMNKNIRIMSKNPDDPKVVAKTIIDARGSRLSRHRAFYFHSGETAECRIEGVTIKNALWIGTVGANGGGTPAHPISPDEINNPQDATPPTRMAGGADAAGTGYGGAILCENGSSPTFRNCVIEDCGVVAAWGGDGISGPAIPTGSTADGSWGGHAGSGSGNGYGGAVACLGESKPKFVDCTIRNCTARGGMGGSGGNGSNPNLGSGRESWGGNAGNAAGDGRGGAVYCETGSDAVFENCVFANNRAINGSPGNVGQPGPGNGLADPYPNPAAAGAPGGTAPVLVVGGAVYQVGANPKFIGCQFSQNEAYETYMVANDEARVYTMGGAYYSEAGNEVVLKDCRFAENANSAVFVLGNCTVDFRGCVFTKNKMINPFTNIASLDPNFFDPNGFDPNTITVSDVVDPLFIGPSNTEVTM